MIISVRVKYPQVFTHLQQDLQGLCKWVDTKAQGSDTPNISSITARKS